MLEPAVLGTCLTVVNAHEYDGTHLASTMDRTTQGMVARTPHRLRVSGGKILVETVYQVAHMAKAVVSVSRTSDRGNRVAFAAEGVRVEHVTSGTRTGCGRENHVHALMAWVKRLVIMKKSRLWRSVDKAEAEVYEAAREARVGRTIRCERT